MQTTFTQAASSNLIGSQATPNVVSNDSTALQASVNVRNHFEQLTLEREAWENNVYRTSNEQLYAILQKCYQTYQAMTSASDEAKALRSGLQDYINSKGLKFKDGTHTIVKIVKCVFGDDRRRVSAYGIVLRTALAQNIFAYDIPAFIRSNGGVEEIRLTKAPNAMSLKQKASVATVAVQSENMGVFSSAALAQKLDAGNIGKTVVMLGTWQADGSVVMRSVVESEGAINAALASYYVSHKKALTTQATQQEVVSDLQAAREVIANAAAAGAVFA